MTITKAFDTSRHNHPITREYPNGVPIDFEKAYADGYRIHSPRASVGNYYIDPWFAADFDAGRAAGFIEVPYHASAPEYPDAQQYDKFIQALGGRRPDGIVLDAELSRGMTPERVTECNQYLASRFSQMCPGRVLAYTNQDFADNYLLSDLDLPLFVANPGPGGGMHTGTRPAMPRLWNEYIAWQKSWTHTIPGVPDPTTDYSEFQMSEAEARAYFLMDEMEDDMTAEILGKLDKVLENQDTIMEALGLVIAFLDNPGDVPPPVDPPVEPEYFAKVTVAKANARFSKANNANGLPIMQIYPSDSSLVRDRIQFLEGDLLLVLPDKVRADGGGYLYQLVTVKGKDGEALYIRAEECMKTW